MKRSGFVLALATACAVGFGARAVFSDEPPTKEPAGDPEEESVQGAAPGEEHARLAAALEGEWTVHGKMSGEDGSATDFDGAISMTMVLGGRFLEQKATATMGGGPFEGRGWIGYDNARKRWVSAWIDTYGTGILSGDGEETEKGKAWTFRSTMQGPKGPVAMKDVVKVVSAKEISWESFLGDADKAMVSMTFKRK